MKIVVTGQKDYYGSVSRWAMNAWEELGHEVVRVEYTDIKNVPKKADIYFFCDVSTDFSADIPDDLEGVKIFWAMDVQMPGGAERSVNIARKCDYTFCTNYEYGVKILEKFGIQSMWVPYGYDRGLATSIYIEEAKEGYEDVRKYPYDVCMIGNANSPERVKLWELLKQKYKEQSVVGTIYDEKKYIHAKAGSKIMIAQPTEPFNTIINLRVFNALCNGKFLLCKRPQISEHELLGMRDGENLVYWDDFDDLIKKIHFYLVNDEERDRIAVNGFDLASAMFMSDRIKIIEQVIFNLFYERLKK